MRAMRRMLAWAMVVTLAGLPISGLTGCASEKKVDPILPFVAMPDLEGAGLRQTWERRISLEPGEHLLQAWRVGSSIYISSTDSRLFRLDAKTGVLAWSKGLGAENIRMRRPIELRTEGAAPREVLVVALGEAFVFDILTGDVVRQMSTGVSASTAPVMVGETLCFGAGERIMGMYPDMHRKWNVREEGDLFMSNPVAAETNVFFASKTGKLWRLSADTGLADWKDRKTDGPVIAGLVADGRALYVPCLNQRVYAFNVDTASLIWQSQLEGILDQTPSLGGSVIMVPSGGRGLYGLNRQNGDFRWEAPGVKSVATVSSDHAWVGDEAGNLKSLTLDTGGVISSTPIPDVQFFVRNNEDDAVILVNRTGVVGLYMPK